MHGTVAGEHVAAGHRLASIRSPLVAHGRLKADRVRRTGGVGDCEEQSALRVDLHTVGTVKSQRDLPHIGTGRHHKIVFKLALVSVVPHIDAVIHTAVKDRRMAGHVLQPLGRFSDKVIGTGNDVALRHAGHVGRRVLQHHVQRSRGTCAVVQQDRCVSILQRQLVATSARDEVDASGRLTQVGFEIETQTVTLLRQNRGIGH